MYEIGDKVFVKKYGAGIIKAIEEKNIDGIVKKYYQIELNNNKMSIFLPIEDDEKVRAIIKIGDAEKVIDILKSGDYKLPNTSLERYKVYKNTLLSYDIFEYAKVLKAIAEKYKFKKAPRLDYKAMDEFVMLISSEISIALDEGFETTKKKIIEILNLRNYKWLNLIKIFIIEISWLIMYINI